MPPAVRPRVLALTCVALTALALNSILCRAALGAGAIDAATFSVLRVASGAALLAALHLARRRTGPPSRSGSWASAAALAAYALAFSLAYGTLHAGAGALILFGCVQITMLLGGARRGERLAARDVLALAIAIAGLALLLAPGATAPPLRGAALMALAGLAWGIYSLRGRGAADPIATTAGNFARAVPITLALAAVALLVTRTEAAPVDLVATPRGLVLAATSGAITSGLGYVAWYAALPTLGAVRGAIVQLAVPVLTAIFGVALLGEFVSARLVLAAALVLGGIALSIERRPR
jgi:drug/metabolite transporter (DMT)-like permease